jgi:uncharacterized protein (TIGR03382 family)
VCGLGANGYDCQIPTSACGSVPETGVCVGADAQYCSSGTVQAVSCGAYPCRAFTYGGLAVSFCYPCPSHATWQDAAGGNGTCSCDAGYQESPDQTSCVPSGGGGGGGCSSGGAAGLLPALALAWLALGRRRRP